MSLRPRYNKVKETLMRMTSGCPSPLIFVTTYVTPISTQPVNHYIKPFTTIFLNKERKKKRKALSPLMMTQRHILLVTFPVQGHINPALQFANRLIRIGVHVTFAISTFIRHSMTKVAGLKGLTLVEYNDGYDDGVKGTNDDFEHYMSTLKKCGSRALNEIIKDSASKGRPVDCLVYTLLLPWTVDVARAHHIPSALICVQAATVFDLYYYYFNGYGDIIRNKFTEDPSCFIKFPKLSIPFTSRGLPSFFNPTNPYTFLLPQFQEQLEKLAEETNPKVLVNTFDALEPDALSVVDGMNLVGIGPLIQSDNSFSANLYQPSDHKYMEWLDSKPESSVVYVSFGSISVLSKRQMEEMERGLLESGRAFIWVVRPPREGAEDYYKAMSSKELNGNMVLSWCAQVEVLSHPSVGCFVTHCGWNSTLESLISGVPMVAFPQWSDQGTNAMLVEEVWKTGVRVTESGEDGLVEGEEIKRCLEIVMGGGERGEEIRRNAKKMKDTASEAAKEGGSSDKNLRAFVDEIAQVSGIN